MVGSPTDATTWTHHIATIDVVIATTRDDKADELMLAIFKLAADAAQRVRPRGAPKLAFIATTGTGVHGNNRTEFVTDTTPVTRPIPLAAGSANLEQVILTNGVVNGIVIRPSLLYGQSGSLLDIMFSSAAGGKAQWYGKSGGRFALIHADDLADLYLRAAEKAQLVTGKAFSAANDFTESIDEALKKATEVSGAQEAPVYLDAAGKRERSCLAYSPRCATWLKKILPSVLGDARNDDVATPLPGQNFVGLAAEKARPCRGHANFLCGMEGVKGRCLDHICRFGREYCTNSSTDLDVQTLDSLLPSGRYGSHL